MVLQSRLLNRFPQNACSEHSEFTALLTGVCEIFIPANIRLFNINNDNVIMCYVTDNQKTLKDKLS